jgi:hypothetical protein
VGKYLVPLTMIAAMAGFATAAMTAGMLTERPIWWPAVVALAVLGGIAPMIYAVNIRVVPVFSRRPWRSLPLLRAQIATLLAGAWLIYAGRLGGWDAVITAGYLLALASGILFMVNIARLFRQAPVTPAPPRPFPNQADVDRIAVKFTRWSSIYLLLGLSIGVLLRFWEPDQGRWDLVWAHTMLVGFMLSMVAGTCYHVLSRWTGHPWRSLTPIRLHLMTVVLGLPLMLIALATNQETLFSIAGSLQAIAVILFLVTITPQVARMPGVSKPAMLAAALLLATGVFLGAWFAGHPVMGARLRLVHAEINLFGFAGLLIAGVGYYLVPRFAGRPLRWPRLAILQLALLSGGVLAGSTALAFRAYGHVSEAAIIGAHALLAAGFALLGLLIAATFFRKPTTATISTIQLGASRPPMHRPNAG